MKVKNTTIYVGQDERCLRHREENAAEEQKNRKTILATQLNGQGDSILLKKQLAQKKAMKIVGDTYAAERKLDQDQDDRREHVKELTEQLSHMRELIDAQDSVEIPEEEMTEEMKADREETLLEFQKQYDALEKEIKAENATIRDVRLERLKTTPMLDAQQEAEEIMDAANAEIYGMLWEEAKDHIDEEQEKREEQAEKIAEKKEEEEERLDKAEEERKEEEEITEMITRGDSDADSVQKELEEIVEKMKLIQEDLKGAAVDTKL